ncbi:hypothetical protein L210DRAFT_3651152 [Boletus edulis BED1]|uniref:Uncharacterized protein n=1 Tax=Boletus edulis BED1 TaxID=1328754 RepID=A0AAD4BIZ9_BOLED|nr:hypothetical protein L210DRAFT_3651152 [Boletus edulis BED1]
MSQLSTSTEMGTLQPVFDDPAIHVKKLKKKAKKAIARAINNYHQQQVVTADMLEARLSSANDLVLKLSIPKPPQLQVLERDLGDSITILKDKNRIFGTPLSVNELLDPLEERENLDMEAEMFEDDAEIIAETKMISWGGSDGDIRADCTG